MELAENVAPFVAHEMAQEMALVHAEQVRASSRRVLWTDTRLRRRILALEGVISRYEGGVGPQVRESEGGESSRTSSNFLFSTQL